MDLKEMIFRRKSTRSFTNEPVDAKMLSDMNCIDVGIALAHLFVTFPDTFRFFQVDDVPSPRGYSYLGSLLL